MNTGSNLIKDVSGYNLTSLFIGSEGTLGIVCDATLKLIPKVENDATKEDLKEINFEAVRGGEGIKRATVEIG